MVRILLLLILCICVASGAAYGEATNNPPAASAPKFGNVAVIKEGSLSHGSLDRAIEQFKPGATNIVLKLDHPATSTAEALPAVQTVSPRPMVAMAEYRGWFWFATDVIMAAGDKGGVTFLGGYAVEKGGRDVQKWGM